MAKFKLDEVDHHEFHLYTMEWTSTAARLR